MLKVINSLLTGGIFVIIIGLGIQGEPVFAEGYSGYAGAFLRMGSGAAALGSGEAGVARSMGVEQSHYNPAGLPFAPGNEINAGYHVLSLDRKLAHLGILYQVKSVSFWRDPLRPLVLYEPKDSNDLAELAVPGSMPGRRGRQVKVDDFIQPLAEAISGYANDNIDVMDESFDPQIVMEGTSVKVPSLKILFIETVPGIRRLSLKTDEEVLVFLKTNYRTSREKPAAAAVTWTHAGTDEIGGYDFNGRRYGTLGYYENRFALSFGIKIHHKISLGITAGVLYALVPDLLEEETKALTSTTFGADVGLQVRPFRGDLMPYRLETLSFGMAAYDLAAKNSWNTTGYWSLGTTKTDYFPRRYRAGFSYSPIRDLEAFFDLETDLDELVRPKGGFEYHLLGWGNTKDYNFRDAGESSGGKIYGLALRTGWDRDRPTFGVGLNFNLRGLGATRLDYAYVAEPVSPEPTQIISWRFRF
ncbi:MAG: hypothetical protein P9L92_16270 [Candidatus Electryonea clarkiae]|nr:hypothetical protein [Candidatus Electryonea clarkiae]MDP8288588.1 hypothetical protein [Candidatus Electryonea clarkiae]